MLIVSIKRALVPFSQFLQHERVHFDAYTNQGCRKCSSKVVSITASLKAE